MTDDEPAAVIASMTDGEPLPIASVTVNEPATIESVAIREPVAIEHSPSNNPGPLRTDFLQFAHILIHNVMAHPIGQLVIATSNQDSIGQQYQPTATVLDQEQRPAIVLNPHPTAMVLNQNPIVTLQGQNTTATVLEQKPAATVLDQNPIATVLHTVQNGTD
eukprot:Em0019g521a